MKQITDQDKIKYYDQVMEMLEHTIHFMKCNKPLNEHGQGTLAAYENVCKILTGRHACYQDED